MRIKFGPWLPDQPDLDSGGLEECANCLPLEGGSYGPVRESTSASGSATISLAAYTPVSSLLYPTLANGAYLFVGTVGQGGIKRFFCDDAFSGGTTSLTYADVSRTLTYTLTTATWSFARFGDSVYAANALDAMQVGSISTNFRDQSASASSPIARNLAVVRDFMFAGNITSGGVGAGGNRVQWCQINNPQRWTPSPRLQSDFQDLPDTGDILAMTGGDFAAIFTERSIWRATYVGSPVIFRFDEVAPSVAIHAPWSAARYQNLTFFLSKSGFQIFDGQQCIPIGTAAVDKYVFDRMAQGTYPDYPLVRGIIDPVNKFYIFSVRGSSGAGVSGTGLELLIYNFVSQRWSRIVKDHSLITEPVILAAGLGRATSSTPLPRYNPVGRPGMGFFGPSEPLSALKVYQEFNSSSYMTATFATGEAQLFPDRRAMVQRVRPLVQGNSSTSVTVEVGKRNKLNESVTYTSAVAMNANGVCPVRADARYHRVRVNVSGGFERAIGFDLDAVKAGIR